MIVLAALVATVALHAAGSGALATPPLGSWQSLDAWYVRSGPALAVVALVRLMAFAAGCWLVVAGALQLLAATIARERFSAVVDGISPRFLRVLAKGAAGLSVTAGLALPVPSGAAENPPGTAVMVPLDVPAGPTSTSTTVPTTAPTSTSATAPTTSTSTTTPPTPTAVVAAEVDAPEVRHDEVVVARGDSFWSIAVDEAGEHELVGYWRALVEANRDRLVDPSNPDLLYPDQVLRLP